jgi:hypothetical protein
MPYSNFSDWTSVRLSEYIPAHRSSPAYKLLMFPCRNSTITNPLAYNILAMDFELWSRCSRAVQEAHFDHFVILLETSKFKRFNLKQRLAKILPIRKLLFVLQTEMYPRQMAPALVQSLTTFLRYHFSADAAIKPVISYLAANLHDGEPTNFL